MTCHHGEYRLYIFMLKIKGLNIKDKIEREGGKRPDQSNILVKTNIERMMIALPRFPGQPFCSY